MSQETFQIELTAQEFSALAAKLKALNLGPNYLVSGALPVTSGVHLFYQAATAADGSSLVTFTVLAKPFFVGLGMIQQKVQQFISEAQSQ